ncbi:MAG: PIN domain-containing protein [Thermoplasmata archaeon]|nr:MAG: PIN domain-containing protein [Thermoplasmata archaeon]
MLLVVDTNIIISGLIKGSVTREILLSADISFVVPEWVHTEIKKHKKLITKKAGIDQDELNNFIEELFQIVQTIPFDKYKSYIKKGLNVMNDIDKDDAPFAAIALALDADGIWTNDKDFEKQDVIKVWKTQRSN